MNDAAYVHGYGTREAQRLDDQARTLEDLLHHDTGFPAGTSVLEAGCGVGAQTVALLRRSPGAHVTAIDISAVSLAVAKQRLAAENLSGVAFQQADLHDLPFADGSFDHVFLCFVLEHLPQPAAALAALHRVLRPGGTITVIEGDHGSVFFHPEDAAARDAIACQVTLQAQAGGDTMVGRALFPLLTEAGFGEISVSPRQVWVDGSRPHWIEGFTRNTFTAMVEGVRDAALAAGLLNAARFDAGVTALRRTAAPDGTFSYTFFKAVARK